MEKNCSRIKKNIGRPIIFKITRAIHLIRIILKAGQILYNLLLEISGFYRSTDTLDPKMIYQINFQFLATTMALESVFWTVVTNGMTPQDIMEDNFGMFTTSLNFQ